MLAVHQRLLLACRQVHMVAADGTIGQAAGYDDIGFLAPPKYVQSGDNVALVGWIPEGLVVAFRGTLSLGTAGSLPDWMIDFDARLITDPRYPGAVHEGFVGALDSVWEDILSASSASSAVADDNIFYTGHSKGGALAHLAAWRDKGQYPRLAGKVAKVVTFAAPRCGNAEFAQAYGQAFPQSVSYEWQDDLVPHLPPSATIQSLLDRIPALAQLNLTSGYEDLPGLKFFSWNGSVQPNSLGLRFERAFHLTEKLAALDFEGLGRAHSIDAGSGYETALVAVVAAGVGD